MKDLDLAPFEWHCNHCAAVVGFAADPTPIYQHLALECPTLDEERAAEHAVHLGQMREWPPVRRAMVAHLIKHPEDQDATFRRPASLPAN